MNQLTEISKAALKTRFPWLGTNEILSVEGSDVIDQLNDWWNSLNDPPAEDPLDQRFRKTAEKWYVQEGFVQIDPGAIVSRSGTGAYVMAWVWVDSEDLEAACPSK